MPAFCAVVNCGSNADRDKHLRFFRIPSMKDKSRKINELSRRRQEAWLKAIKRADMTELKIKYGRVCSRHFHSGQPSAASDVDHPDWAPSKHMGYQNRVTDKVLERYKRAKGRVEIAESPISNITPDDNLEFEDIPREPTIEELKFALQKANEQIYCLKEEVSKFKLDENYLQKSDEIVLYYTGFPQYTYVQNIFKIIEPHLAENPALSKFQQLLLTLMKLRLNLQYTDLAYRFLCHRTTVARTFERVVDILYCKFKSLINWPSREELQLNMPVCFQNVFGNKVTVIIDCFEVFIEKPSNLEAASKTWSNYKHHNTAKFLIGISPQGSIMFISNAYGGRASDKFIVQDSGILNNLIRGDLIITDRGFAIDESVKIFDAEVRYPAFLKGKNQLQAVDMETTRKLASVRVHVERVIGVLRRKFRIVGEQFTIVSLKNGSNDYLLIDKIVVICSAFVNLCPGIVAVDF